MTARAEVANSGRSRLALSRADCLALLAPGGHGRVAITMAALPVIIPVSFTVANDEITFGACWGQGMARAVAQSVVAFQTDYRGPSGYAEWGVHVTGIASDAAGDAATATFRLSAEIISGWRTVPEVRQ
ncbi:MAG: hypothetical protein JWL70_1239 [Acidimicrobiia bacterium]|nr:hypothetical protein [Acidimicrobiia bacterium]